MSTEYDIIYKDDGCFLHPSCLNCPEPICIFDFPGYKKSWVKFKKVCDLSSKGYSIEKISEEMCIPVNQVKKLLSYKENLVVV